MDNYPKIIPVSPSFLEHWSVVYNLPLTFQIFQLALDEEVNADASSCKRSQVTGHLLITMPKTKQIVKPAKPPTTVSGKDVDNNNKENVGGKDSNIRYSNCSEILYTSSFRKNLQCCR